MADPDKDETGEYVAQAFNENSPVSEGEDVGQAVGRESNRDACSPLPQPEWSEDPVEPMETDGAGEERQGGEGDPEELDGAPVFGVDQDADPWDLDAPLLGEPYPDTSNTGSDSRLIEMEEDPWQPPQMQDGGEEEEEEDDDNVGRKEGSDSDSQSENADPVLMEDTEISNSAGLSPIAGDEGVSGHPEPGAPDSRAEEDVTPSTPPRTPPPGTSQDQHRSESQEPDLQAEECPSPSPLPSSIDTPGVVADVEERLSPIAPVIDIKDEPIDEGYDAALQPQSSSSSSRVKQELEHSEEYGGPSTNSEQLRISAVFSVSGESSSPAAPVPFPQPMMLAPVRASLAPRFGPPLALAPPLISPHLSLAPPPLLAGPGPRMPSFMAMICCSGCGKVLKKGQTAFQRKGSNQFFCSTICLTKAAPPPPPAPPLAALAPRIPSAPLILPPSKPRAQPPLQPQTLPQYPSPAVPLAQRKFCFHCLNEISVMKDLIKAPIAGTVRDFCSQACLHNRRRKMAREAGEKIDEDELCGCSICQKLAKVEHEVNHLGTMYKLCSDHCFARFRVINSVALNACELCWRSCSKSEGSRQLLLADSTIKKFCSSDCIFNFRQKCKMSFPCAKCQTMCTAHSMLEGNNQHGVTELFCTNKCRVTKRMPNVLADAQFPCTHCQKVGIPQYHLATGDGAIRNFCSLSCATIYQEKNSSSTPQNQAPNINGLPPNPSTLAPKAPAPAAPQQAPAQPPQRPPHIPAPGAPQPKDPLLQQQLNQPPLQQRPPPSQQQSQQTSHSSATTTYQMPRIYCKQCSQGFHTKPHVLQHKGQVWLFCGKTCCELFKRHNEILVRCEYCKLDRMLKDITLTYENRPRTFCSQGCKLLFKHDLSKRAGGQQWIACAHCANVAFKTVSSLFRGKVEEFCSRSCMSAYTAVFYEMAECDACKKKGRMTDCLKWNQSGNSISGGGDTMKHFCNQLCFTNFCLRASKQNQPLTNGNAPKPRPTGPVSAPALPPVSKETPVIVDVVSLASAPSRQPTDAAHTPLTGALPNAASHSKIIGDASTQTDAMKAPSSSPPPRHTLKNKALMCKPIMQEQGIQCFLETLLKDTPTKLLANEKEVNADVHNDDEKQTPGAPPHKGPDDEEKVRYVPVPIPVPVPVYIPVPMNMYSQYMPVPSMGIGLPVPVPLMVPSKADGTDKGAAKGGATTTTTTPQGEEEEEVEKKDTPPSVGEQGSTYSGDLESEAVSTPHSLEDDTNPSNSTSKSLTSTTDGVQDPTSSHTDPTQHTSPQHLGASTEQRLALKQRGSKRPREGAPLRKRTKKRGASPLGGSLTPSGGLRLNHMYGVQAWLSWVQWRNKQLNSGGKPIGARLMVLKEDVLHCSTSELSYGLCRFISEVRRPDGEPYTADSIYCLCLGIQQYLFENGRIENIFTDSLYHRFTMDITKMLKTWGQSVEPHELLQSRVEEEYLWQCKQLGAYSPIVLLSTLLFFLTKLLRLHTPTQHRQLAFTHISRHPHSVSTPTSPTSPAAAAGGATNRTAFLRFRVKGLQRDAKLAKRKKMDNDGEDDDDGQEADVEIPENTENPLRCPVRLYEFYLSKCPESVSKRADVLYLQPERVCDPNTQLWFTDQPLESATLENLLTRIQVVRQVYTGDTEDENQASTSSDESS